MQIQILGLYIICFFRLIFLPIQIVSQIQKAIFVHNPMEYISFIHANILFSQIHFSFHLHSPLYALSCMHACVYSYIHYSLRVTPF